MLGDLDPRSFLEQHWQERPLLVRNAIPGFSPPIAPEDLAAPCSDGVDAGIVLESSGDRPREDGADRRGDERRRGLPARRVDIGALLLEWPAAAGVVENDTEGDP